MKKIVLVGFAGALALGQTAQAVTLSAVDSGTFLFSSTSGGIGAGTSISHTSSNTAIGFSYAFGGFANFSHAAFAIFDLSGVTGSVTAATLEMSLSVNNTALGSPGSYVFNQVSSDPALFDSSYSERSNCFGLPCDPLGTGRDLYFDLSDGAALGTVSYSGVGSQTAELGAGGVDLINLGLGGLFAIGINNAGGNGLGGVTFAAPQLTLVVAAVPVPAAVWLLGSALAGLLGFGRRAQTQIY